MDKKPIIIAIVGASGTGKTTLANHLSEKCGIPSICSYTTRPGREGETDGKEHYFEDSLLRLPKEPLAYTYFGGHHYWATHQQIEGLKYCTYVIDEKGLIELQRKWGDRYEILSVHIERQDINGIDKARMKRDEERLTLSDYDIILDNKGTLDDFLAIATTTILTFIA